MSEKPSPAGLAFGDIAPALAAYTDDVLFGGLWKRPGLATPPDRMRKEIIFPKPRNHPEADALYQSGMTLGGARMTMVELLVAAAALAGACIFLAHAIEGYRAH